MAFDFTGKRVLVTGAGRGIGQAIATTLAQSGCKVYALSRTKSTLDSLVQQYPDIVPIVQDVSDWDGTRAKLEEIEPLDGLVNNAGVLAHMGPALDFPKDMIDAHLNNNLLSVINCTQVVAKKMIDSGRAGSIVNVSGASSQSAFPQFLGINVSKAGVDMVTKQFALELGPHNIRVNSVNPTLVLTERVKQMVQPGAEEGIRLDLIFLERTPLQRISSVQEVVWPILYLLSDSSSMVTGTCHIVDGGLTCNITIKQ